MAAETITSDPIQTAVGASGTKLETYTQTTFTRDSNGKIDPKSTKTEIFLNNSTIPGVKNWVPAAASTDGGKTWDTTSERYQKLDKSPVLGTDAQKSLKEGALKTNTNQQIGTAATKAEIPPEQQKTLSDGIKNNGGGEFDSDQFTAAAGKENAKTRNEFKGAGGTDPLRYPLSLKSDYQDVIKFKMVKYSPKKFASQTFGFSNREQVGSKNRNIIGTVVLPIPAGISDTNSASWNGADMNAAAAAAANMALSGIEGGGEAMGNTAENIANTVVGASDAVKKAIAVSFAENATGTSGLLSRTTGQIINPNMELLFNAPTLRPFNFTFKMSARSPEESKAILSIIRFFKQGMSPIRTESTLFLKSPHTFQLEYLHRNKEHKFLNKFKECALTSFTENYTPEGQYATYTDGAMASYEISMQFQELEPIFNDDYGRGSGSTGYDTEIGY